MFIEQVKAQLKKMSEVEKEEWILDQAKVLHEYEQMNFLMSLSGAKRVQYMPTLENIKLFLKDVEQGDIYLEYETHYYEYDDDGRYFGDWKVWYNDPFRAMSYLERIFRGCHDLLLLQEYKQVEDILDMVCNLEFEVVEAPDSEDVYDGSPFFLSDAVKEDLLSVSANDIGTDWIKAIIHLQEEWGGLDLAKRLVKVFANPFFKKLEPSILVGEKIPQDLFSNMADILEDQITDIKIYLDKNFPKNMFSNERYRYEEILERQKEVLLNIHERCLGADNGKTTTKSSMLADSWEQIKGLFKELGSYEYIDDQVEIEEISDICDELMDPNKLGQEDWELRKSILSDIIGQYYYDAYGCYDSMFDLSRALCVTKDEFLKFADMLNAIKYYQKEAAFIYREYGREDKYIGYLETHLDKDSKLYVELIEYYKKDDRADDARQVAEKALVKCKNDLTDVYIFLLIDALNRVDCEQHKKLYNSAKRRRMVDMNRLEQALTEAEREE